MSYILDALRKADAQRERDPARGIHAQTLHPLTGGGRARNSYRPWLLAACAAGAATAAGAGWLILQDKPSPAPRPVVVAQADNPGGTGAGAPAPVQAPAPAPAAPVVGNEVQPPAPAFIPRPQQQRDPRVSSQPTMRGGPQQATPGAPAPAAPAVAQPAPAAPGAPAATAAPAPVIPSVNPPPPPLPSPPVAATTPAAPVAGLPADAPKLAIGGGVYSNNPAQRMLIVNGQVFNEGSEVGPGVVLEQIKSKGAVLRFRGARYSVTY